MTLVLLDQDAPSRVRAIMTRQPPKTMEVAISHLAFTDAWMSMPATFRRPPSATMEVAIMSLVQAADCLQRAILTARHSSMT